MATATMDVSAPTTLLPAAKASGRCPPSLIRDDQIIEGGVFEMAMLRALDRRSQGFILSLEPGTVENFTSAMKMASGNSSSSRILEQRRCLLLAAIGSTAENMPSNSTMRSLMKAGLLVTIKAWLDDILVGSVGGVDLLLHLLSNIIPLPVTKELVTTSRLGKTVTSVEKHTICVKGKNEDAIKKRIKQVKATWSASVKAMKNRGNATTESSSEPIKSANAATKRSLNEATHTTAKKAKYEGSSLSNLLKKVENTNNVASSSTMSGAEEKEREAKLKQQERDAKLKERQAAANCKSAELNEDVVEHPMKDARRIHWADKCGQKLAVSDGGKPDTATKAEPEKARHSRWSDRTKKDIRHEKELLLKSRKVGSVDHDKDDMLNAMAMMAMWKPPQPLPQDKQIPAVQVTSNEMTVQTRRIGTTPAVRYSSENDIPISPTLLSEVEKALELSRGGNSTPSTIPFFTPQTATNPVDSGSQSNVALSYPPQAQLTSSSEASLETVLMMGLPLFLVGSNVQALQTLASNPGLLASFKDANGVYRQPELINLVQTLTQNVMPQATQPIQMPGYNAGSAVQTSQTYYQPSSAPFVQPIAQPQPAQQSDLQLSRGYRGDQNLGDANLHLSGYGPMTTNEQIIAMFAPYVRVTEVVNKSGFSFVNTVDPEGAKQAREALNGSLLGGLPCRINPATRKARNPNFGGGGGGTPAVDEGGLEALPRNSMGQVDFGQVRDDRGNPATKNLFVAGYGPSTTEQQIKDIFGQYATVVSIVMKGTFSFVNTTDRDAAVIARSSLGGQQLNGGALRINFAKETGRLGTSFDSTYGPASASTHASTYGGRY